MSYQQALSLMSQGRANPSSYLINLPPRVVTKYSPKPNEIGNYVSYFTRAITLPATSNSVLSLIGQENIGVQRNVITGRQFGSPVVMTFSDRRDLIIYQTIKNWIDSSIQNSSQSDRTRRSMRVEYYEDVVGEMQIYKLEPKRNIRNPRTDGFRGELVTGVWTLYNAIPLAIEQTTLAVESADSLLDFTFSVAYESFTFKPIHQDDMGDVVIPYTPLNYETNANRSLAR